MVNQDITIYDKGPVTNPLKISVIWTIPGRVPILTGWPPCPKTWRDIKMCVAFLFYYRNACLPDSREWSSPKVI